MPFGYAAVYQLTNNPRSTFIETTAGPNSRSRMNAITVGDSKYKYISQQEPRRDLYRTDEPSSLAILFFLIMHVGHRGGSRMNLAAGEEAAARYTEGSCAFEPVGCDAEKQTAMTVT